MKFHIIAEQAQDATYTVTARCPICGRNATFSKIPDLKDLIAARMEDQLQRLILGQRKCPNPKCNGHVFFVWRTNSGKASDSDLIVYPAEKIDFESANVPPNIVNVFEEALTCHAEQCYIAAAIMIRRTLEEVCADRQATGNALFDHIENLKSKITIPTELFDGLHALRLLGNDAAHLEAQTYVQIGREEIELSIEITKELLKALYQYDSLVKRLEGLKNQSSTP